MTMLNARSLLVLAMGIILCLPEIAKAAPPPLTSPEMAKKLGQFRKEAGGAFIVPQAFGAHPGATFVLTHAKDLGLSDKQIKKIRTIRREMVNRSLKQIARIDKIRARYLDLMKSSNPPLRKALERQENGTARSEGSIVDESCRKYGQDWPGGTFLPAGFFDRTRVIAGFSVSSTDPSSALFQP